MKVEYQQSLYPSSSLSSRSQLQQQKKVVIVSPACGSSSDDCSMHVMSVDQVLASIEKQHQLEQGGGDSLLMRIASEACLTEGTAPTLEMEDMDMDADLNMSSQHDGVVVGSDHISIDEDDDEDDVMDMDVTETSETSDCWGVDDARTPLQAISSSSSHSTRREAQRPAIKLSSLQALSSDFILDKKNAWKSLPKPNLEQILSLSDRTCPGRIQSTTTSTTAAPTATLPRRVSFDSVLIREYEQTLGDNPSVSYGPPIQLDWSYTCCNPITLEDYELNRRPRRKMRQMALNYYHRRNVLQWCCGVTEDELKRAERRANKVKRERALTVAMLPARRFEDFFESASRKVKKSKSKKQQQQQQSFFEQPQALPAPPAPAMRGGAGLPQAMAPPPSFVQQQQRQQVQQQRPGPLAQPPALPQAIVQQKHRPAAPRPQLAQSESSSEVFV